MKEKQKNIDKPAWPAQMGDSKNNMPSGPYDSMFHEGGTSLFWSVRKPRRVLWSIAWSDLMMTMFILFAVLYIYQAANRDFSFGKHAEVPAEQAEAVKKLTPPKIETLIESLSSESSQISHPETETLRLRELSDIGKMELVEDKAVRIVLPGDLLFDAGRAEIKSTAMTTLREVADVLRVTDYKVNVVGHTDDVPIHSDQYATNWELSAIRACVVARFLIEQTKISPERFFVSGHAYFQPAKPNTNPRNKRANRRVELILTKKRPEGIRQYSGDLSFIVNGAG